MAGLPRDSLVARMLQRGTLPAWNLLEKVPKAAAWSESQGRGKPTPALSSASTSAGAASVASAASSASAATTSTSSSKCSGRIPKEPVAKAAKPSPPAASAASSGVGLVATLAKKIRQSLGQVLRPKPTHRKVGKQRPSVLPAPRHRKTGKQRPSHLAKPRPAPPPKSELSDTARAALAAVAVPGNSRKTSGRTEKKSESQERGPAPAPTPKKRSSAAVTSTASAVVPEPVSSMPAPKKPLRKPMKQKEPITKRMKLTTVKRDEDNYEISDMEEDEDGNRIEPDRQGKHIPKWCANYTAVAASQADIDPDSIFGTRMPLCDLDSIFPDSFYLSLHPNQSRQRRRGSSCHWFRDALTPHEIHAYAVKMGQSRAWSTVRASLPGNRPGEQEKVVALVKPKETSARSAL